MSYFIAVCASSTLAKMVDGEWVPGIGDPTPMGWVTVAVYFLAAGSCGWCAGMTAGLSRRGAWWHAGLWWALTLFLLALGINKQLDLQSAVTVYGREWAQEQGWYQHRRAVQLWFVTGLGATALVGLGLLLWAARFSWWRSWPALLGVVLTAGFVVLRAASLHRVDRLLFTEVWGIRGNWVLELGALAVILMGVLWCKSAHRAALRQAAPEKPSDPAWPDTV